MKYKYEIIAPLIGILLGYVTIHSFFAQSWLSIILWAVVGVIFVSFINEKKQVTVAGLLYGFFLCFSWLQFGFSGNSNIHTTFIIFSLLLSILASAVSFGWFLLVYWIEKKILKK